MPTDGFFLLLLFLFSLCQCKMYMNAGWLFSSNVDKLVFYSKIIPLWNEKTTQTHTHIPLERLQSNIRIFMLKKSNYNVKSIHCFTFCWWSLLRSIACHSHLHYYWFFSIDHSDLAILIRPSSYFYSLSPALSLARSFPRSQSVRVLHSNCVVFFSPIQ